MTDEQARELAMSLPEASEQDHHGRPSFRVGGKIFATLWAPGAMNVMAGEGRIRAAVEEAPGYCSPVMWGKRLAAVQVDLAAVTDPEFVADLLEEAWSCKAPKRLKR